MNKGNRDDRLEQVAQRIENVIADRENHSLLLHSNSRSNSSPSASAMTNINTVSGDKPLKVPEVVKDIIMHDFGDTDEDDDSLKTPKTSPRSHNHQKSFTREMGFESVNQLKLENKTLKSNLYKVEDDLIRVKAERDNMVIKYNALNERVSKSFVSDKSPGRRMSMTSEDQINVNSMSEINLQLRKQLDDDHRDYKQKLACHQEQQLKQADLINKLHNKLQRLEGRNGVIENLKDEKEKLKCDIVKVQNSFSISTSQLNERLDAAENHIKSVESDRSMDVESVLLELKDEQAKCANLAQVNGLLREQLDEATIANIGLTEDVQKLTEDWQILRGELDQKEYDWKDDEATFSRYLASEQSRIKTLWNNVVNFKRQFNDIKAANERDLHQIRVDVEHSTQSLRLACSNFDANFKSKINQLEFQLATEKSNSNQLENLLQKLKEDLRKSESQYQKQLEAINEQFANVNRSNEQLTKELEDKEKILSTLYKLRNGIITDMDSSTFGMEDPATRQLIIDTDAVHQALRDIAQMIMNDNDQVDDSPWVQDDMLEDNRTNLRATFSTNSLHSNRSVSPTRTPKKVQCNTGSLDRHRMFRGKSPVSVADSTCAAVRSAFQKRAFQVQDMSNKLNTIKMNSNSLRKQLEESENERRNLENQLIEIRREFDSNHRELDDTQRECERMRHTMSMLEDDKLKLERSRQCLLEEAKIDKQELEKLKMSNYELQRDTETVADNNDEFQRNMERQTKELEHLNKILELSDGKNSRLREEISTLKESFNKIILEKEVLEQEKLSIIDSLNKAELAKADYEVKFNKQRTEETKFRDKINQQDSNIHSMTKELTELKAILEKVETEKSRLSSDKKALEQEKYGIREELLRVENEKEELHQLKHGLRESIQSVEKSYENLQDDLSKLNSEKLELENKNTVILRERNVLSSELLQARRDAERLSSAVQKLMKEKESLFNEKSDLISQLTSFDREVRDNANAIFSLQEEKEQLDSDLYESQQTIQKLQGNIETLEGNLQQLERKQSVLFDEKQKLQHECDIELLKQNKLKETLQIKLNESEKEWSRILNMEKKAREDDIERLISEREDSRMEFTKYKDDMKKQYIEEIDDIRIRLNRDKEELAQEIITIQRERDDYLLESEMNKQHTINLLDQEKSVLLEKISYLTDALKTTESDLDRTRSECEARGRQDQNTIQSMNTDLKKFRIQFEQTHAEHDREIKNLQTSYKDLENLRYQDHREIEELKSLLKIAEDTRDSLRQDLTDSLARLRETEDNKERLRRELQDEKRNYFEEKKEVETLQTSNKDLRQKIKHNEILKIDLQRQIQDLLQKLAVFDEQKLFTNKELKDTRFNLQETEKARHDARRELEDLRNQVKKLDTERGKLFNEVSGLQMRISSDEEKEVETRKENFGLKQKVMESEATKEELSKQLFKCQRRIDDLEEILSSKEKANNQNYDELFREYKKLEELKTKFENKLESLNIDVEDFRNSLIAKDGKINILENNFLAIDRKRKDAESRLGMIHNHLRKLIGFRQQSNTTRNRSPSPQRRSRSISPDKGRASGRNSAEFNNSSEDRRKMNKISESSQFYEATIPGSDLEPEAVRMALRDITEHIVNLERERDDVEIKAKNSSLKIQELNAQLDQALQRISMMQINFGEIEEDKKGIDGRLSSAQTALMMQEEAIHRNERERKSLNDTVTKLERQLSVVETEKRYLQERVDKLRSNEIYHEEERKGLIKAVDDAENRCTQLELLRRGLEGEFQRLRMGLNDKETENQVLKDRIDSLIKQISDLESKSQSLQLTIDRLSMNLARTEEEENTQKDKVHQLNLTLTENQNSFQNLQEKIQQLQNNIANSEHDRRVLQERLESLKHNLTEAKSQNHNITDRLQATQQELSESESRKNELEAEARRINQVLSQRQEIEQDLQAKVHKTAMEKNLLTERLNSLTASLAGLESDRKDIEKSHSKVEKERHALRKTLDKLEKEKNRSEEIVSHTLLKRNEFEECVRRLEDENEVLHRQVQKLQNQLAEAEQCHAQRLMDLSSRIKSEMLSEIERLKSALSSTEKTLQFREKAHRQKVKGLEEQITLLKDQFSKEMKKRESYLSKSSRYAKNDISEIRGILERSTNNISKAAVENIIYDIDIQKHESLNETYSPSSTLKLRSSDRPQTAKSALQKDYYDTSLTRQSLTTSPTRASKISQIGKRSMKNI